MTRPRTAPADPDDWPACRYCHTKRPWRHRKRAFCNDACRRKAWRASNWMRVNRLERERYARDGRRRAERVEPEPLRCPAPWKKADEGT